VEDLSPDIAFPAKTVSFAEPLSEVEAGRADFSEVGFGIHHFRYWVRYLSLESLPFLDRAAPADSANARVTSAEPGIAFDSVLRSGVLERGD
jgi:hypothetical protein